MGESVQNIERRVKDRVICRIILFLFLLLSLYVVGKAVYKGVTTFGDEPCGFGGCNPLED